MILLLVLGWVVVGRLRLQCPKAKKLVLAVHYATAANRNVDRSMIVWKPSDKQIDTHQHQFLSYNKLHRCDLVVD